MSKPAVPLKPKLFIHAETNWQTAQLAHMLSGCKISDEIEALQTERMTLECSVRDMQVNYQTYLNTRLEQVDGLNLWGDIRILLIDMKNPRALDDLNDPEREAWGTLAESLAHFKYKYLNIYLVGINYSADNPYCLSAKGFKDAAEKYAEVRLGEHYGGLAILNKDAGATEAQTLLKSITLRYLAMHDHVDEQHLECIALHDFSGEVERQLDVAIQQYDSNEAARFVRVKHATLERLHNELDSILTQNDELISWFLLTIENIYAAIKSNHSLISLIRKQNVTTDQERQSITRLVWLIEHVKKTDSIKAFEELIGISRRILQVDVELTHYITGDDLRLGTLQFFCSHYSEQNEVPLISHVQGYLPRGRVNTWTPVYDYLGDRYSDYIGYMFVVGIIRVLLEKQLNSNAQRQNIGNMLSLFECVVTFGFSQIIHSYNSISDFINSSKRAHIESGTKERQHLAKWLSHNLHFDNFLFATIGAVMPTVFIMLGPMKKSIIDFFVHRSLARDTFSGESLLSIVKIALACFFLYGKLIRNDLYKQESDAPFENKAFHAFWHGDKSGVGVTSPSTKPGKYIDVVPKDPDVFAIAEKLMLFMSSKSPFYAFGKDQVKRVCAYERELLCEAVASFDCVSPAHVNDQVLDKLRSQLTVDDIRRALALLIYFRKYAHIPMRDIQSYMCSHVCIDILIAAFLDKRMAKYPNMSSDNRKFVSGSARESIPFNESLKNKCQREAYELYVAYEATHEGSLVDLIPPSLRLSAAKTGPYSLFYSLSQDAANFTVVGEQRSFTF